MENNVNNENSKIIENQNHIKKVYSDKALKSLKICIGLLIFSCVTYIIGLAFNLFDFGLIFEIISFVFILISYKRIEQHDFKSAKKNIIIAMIPAGWLIIYDFINLLANLEEVLIEVITYYLSFDQLFYYIEPYLFDVILVSLIIFLYRAYISLNRADGTSQARNYTESFYDKL